MRRLVIALGASLALAPVLASSGHAEEAGTYKAVSVDIKEFGKPLINLPYESGGMTMRVRQMALDCLIQNGSAAVPPAFTLQTSDVDGIDIPVITTAQRLGSGALQMGALSLTDFELPPGAAPALRIRPGAGKPISCRFSLTGYTLPR